MIPAQPRHPLALLDALLWQMNRDRPSTSDLLPNRAGDERRVKAELIQGYIDALEPIVAALRAQAEAEAGLRERVERIAEEAAELRQNLRANWVCCTSPVYADGFQSAMNRADALDRAARAALAQAGGESL